MSFHQALTDDAIRGATIPAGQKLAKLADGHGLYVLLTPDGRKQWRVRIKGSDRVLGVFPAVGVAEARAKAAQLRSPAAPPTLVPATIPAAIAAPQAPAPNGATVPTFGQVAREWAEFDTAISGHSAYRKRLHVDKFAALHHKPLTSIPKPECVAVCKAIREASGLPTAMRAARYLYGIFEHAAEHYDIAYNPARGHKAWFAKSDKAEVSRRRRDHTTDPNVFGRIMEAVDTWESPFGPTSSKFLRIIARLPVRAGTLAKARWADFKDLDDPSRALWVVPAGDMKQRNAHEYPLSRQVCALLIEQREYVASHYPAGSPYVFPHRDTGRAHVTGANQLRALKAILKLYKLPESTQSVHGMRHTAMTMAMEAGRPRDVWNMGVLGHVHGDAVEARYDLSKQLEARRAELAWWSDRVEAMRDGYTV